MALGRVSKVHLGIPETVWAEHVSSLASLLAEVAGNAYVWLNVGEVGPTIAENQAALTRIESFGVLTANTEKMGRKRPRGCAGGS